MSNVTERVGVAVIAIMLGYALFLVSTLSIKPLREASQETSAMVQAAPAAVSPDVTNRAATQTAAVNSKAQTAMQSDATETPDPQAGQKVFAKCKSCHAIEAKKNGIGPSLYGVVNRPVASAGGYKYSEAMASHSGNTWTPQSLDQYLGNVKGTIPGTKMAFTGLPKAKDRMDLIAYLAQQSSAPIAPDALGFGNMQTNAIQMTPDSAASTSQAASAEPAGMQPIDGAIVTYTDPPPPTADELAREASSVETLKASISKLDYQRARYHALHNKPFVHSASNGECLSCHQEVLATQVRENSPAGVPAQQSLAWYQTLATYDGPQMTFHQRHMSSPYAQAVMNLKCTFCHQGNDPRDESPTNTVSASDMTSNNGQEPFTNRKMVNPSETCLRCHGAMPDPVNIMGLPGAWPTARKDLESADTPNGCLTCHQQIRTGRHRVTYLNAATIEDLAQASSDVCYGCHGGRAWYRISYPYPRHPWPGMDTAVPEWAKNRKTVSDPRYAIDAPAQ